MLIIDSRMRDFEKAKLIELGYELCELQPNSNLYYEISSHVDIQCTCINNVLVCAPGLSINAPFDGLSINTPIDGLSISTSIQGRTVLGSKYPNDIAYNICIIGNTAIHNFNYTDSKVLELLDKFNFNKIHINQGYSNCSIAVIDDNSCIVTDKAIANELIKNGIETLLIDSTVTDKIHLYKNADNKYSNMHGFIGGCLSRIDNYVFCSGDLNFIDSDGKIREFIFKRDLELIDFKGKDIVDYGGILNTSVK